MEQLFAVDWKELFEFSVPPMEIVVRGSAMYWFLFVLFRFVVRREVGSVGIGDILVMVIVADAAQNAMAGEYTSVLDGFVLVGTLVCWNVFLDWLAFRSPHFRRFAQPPALRLIKNGRLLRSNMRREFISEDELMTKLRQEGVMSFEDVKDAFVEPDGQISVIKREG
jgi:uncharacterized membrane protein YcaP (DUF421 family)